MITEELTVKSVKITPEKATVNSPVLVQVTAEEKVWTWQTVKSRSWEGVTEKAW